MIEAPCDFETIRREEAPQAERIAEFFWQLYPTKNIILDVGCGPGIYTEALRRRGFDAEGCDLDPRLPPEPWFYRVDLTKGVPRKHYDIVLSLEVGEHLPEENATDYIRFIESTHADTVYFSAARPGQGGIGHCNCRFKAYWSQRFALNDFYFDHESTELFLDSMRQGYHMGWLLQNGMVFRRV